NREEIGILVVQIDMNQINTIMQSGSLGKNGEAYLIGHDLKMRSISKLDKSSATIENPVETKITLLWQDEHIKRNAIVATEKKKVEVYKGRKGYEVLGLYYNIEIGGVRLAVITEIPTSEVVDTATEHQKRTLLLFLLMALFTTTIAVIISRRIVTPIIQLSNSAKLVAKGDIDQTIDVKAKYEISELVTSFDNMMTNLRQVRDHNIEDDWFKTGQAFMNEKTRGFEEISTLANNAIGFLAEYLDAQIGALYIAADDNSLKMSGSYAFHERKHLANRITPGEGLVGQAALEKKYILLTNCPPDYIQINSGLGQTSPTNIIVFPLIRENEVISVIELGSLSEFSENHISFLELINDALASSIHSLNSRKRIIALLQQTQDQAEELKKREKELQSSNLTLQKQAEVLRASEEQLQVQQEELRQMNEELEEHTTALKKSETTLLSQQKELQQFNEELEEKTEYLENQKKDIEAKNEDLEMARLIIEDKAKELELSSKYKSEFLANMSHELRTPLNSILLLSKLFVDNKDNSLSEDQVDSAQAIHSSGNDLLRLINEILDLSKIEAGKMDINLENIVLKHLADSVSRNFKHFAQESGIELIVDLESGIPDCINSDQHRFDQIIKNFLSNALKFTPNGSITFKVYVPPEPEYKNLFFDVSPIPKNIVAFSVIDTGIGIPEDKQKLIFEAFQQADGTTSRKYGGTGLGLSISRELAKKLGGRIGLVSKSGEGSAFTLYMPEKQGPSHPEKQSSTKGFDSNPDTPQPIEEDSRPKPKEIKDDRKATTKGDKSILIIEDDPTFAKILRDISRENGFKSLICQDGETGLQFADYYNPSAIILDIGLPGINGWTVMTRLKDNPATRHIPVHFISAADKQKEALRMGAIDFLTKPVTPAMLKQAFENINRIISKEVKDLLIIEDDQNHVKAIAKLIGNGDVKITSANNAEKGFEEIQTGKYDCVILDLKLPDMSGVQLLSKIRNIESLHRLPVIIYTGKELSKEETAILNQYADTTITKGVNSHQRLLDETTLFLHRVEKNLPEQQRKVIRMLHDKEAILEGKRILVVDDDMRNVFSLKKLLEEYNMKVFVGKNGQEGIDKLKSEENIDLILMDIMMPEMDGYEATRRIKGDQTYNKIPIIALTAKAMKGDKAKCIEAGANDYLAKPVDPDRLLSMLRVWLYS
ncbi:response regulator, partial [bacterium]|nr:response regulator [bacterium]